MRARIPLISRYVWAMLWQRTHRTLSNICIYSRADPLLGIGTGLVAHYLYESDPKTEIPPDRRLYALITRRWTDSRDQRHKQAEDVDSEAVQNVLTALSSSTKWLFPFPWVNYIVCLCRSMSYNVFYIIPMLYSYIRAVYSRLFIKNCYMIV